MATGAARSHGSTRAIQNYQHSALEAHAPWREADNTPRKTLKFRTDLMQLLAGLLQMCKQALTFTEIAKETTQETNPNTPCISMYGIDACIHPETTPM